MVTIATTLNPAHLYPVGNHSNHLSCMCVCVSGEYQPALYHQRDDGEFEVVDQSGSEKVRSGVCV